jgi:hypothetical protein
MAINLALLELVSASCYNHPLRRLPARRYAVSPASGSGG